MGPNSTVAKSGSPRADRDPADIVPLRRPAVPAVLALALGICLDRRFDFPVAGWLTASGLFLIAAISAELFRRHRRMAVAASLAVLAGVAAVGGARHHLSWSIWRADDVAAWGTELPKPARIVGVVNGPIEIIDSPYGPQIPAWMEVDRSRCRLQCERLQEGQNWVAISGGVQLDVAGHLVHVRAGDRVEVVGKLSRAGPPSNPGALDYREVLRAQGMTCVLRAGHPMAVHQLERLGGPWWTLVRGRESLRAACQRLFAAELRPEHRALASSLLLGDRSSMTDEIRERFAESGVMHLLAISGLNVGILLGLALVVCRLFNLSSRCTAAALLLCIAAFAMLTNHQPSVLRAALLATIALVGSLRGSPVNGVHSLALCAFVLLLVEPADLFDIGAQLSFLAVAALIWSARYLRAKGCLAEASLPRPESNRLLKPFLPYGRLLFETGVTSAAIWAATLPLTIFIFHLAAPVGILLNLVIIPLGMIILGLGYAFVLIGLLAPSLAALVAWPFEWSLRGLQVLVTCGQAAPLGHFYLPAQPLWWTIGFYLLLAAAWRIIGTQASARLATRGLLVWLAIGLLVPFLPQRRDSLRVTFLAVGHGMASVLELPSGETLLYDAGTIGDGRRAQRAIENALWSRGIRRIDAAILSHADHDHYSGMFGLFDRTPIGSLFVAQTFLDFNQVGVRKLCDLAATHKTPMRLVQAGDRLIMKSDPRSAATEIRVLHPAGEFRSKSDNANSVVLDVRFAGRRILLTGDLELDGLAAVLNLPCGRADVLLAPHHGGRAANVPALYRQVQPDYVVVSTGAEVLPELPAVVGTACLLNTSISGAVTIEIHSDGTLTASEFLSRSLTPRRHSG